MIDKSLDEAINSDNEEYIMQQIRKHYLAKSTVTIHLIGTKSSESLGWDEQKFIKRELQASLYHGDGNTQKSKNISNFGPHCFNKKYKSYIMS